VSARKQADAIEVAWGDESGPIERVKPRRKSKKAAATNRASPSMSWPEKLEEKIRYVADRYVNHGDSRLFWQFQLAWRDDRSKIARDARESLSLDTEALAGFAFFREIEPLIEGNERLEWLRDIVADSLTKRWKQQIATSRIRARNQSNARREKFGRSKKVARRALEWQIPKHKTIASLARHFGVDVKTMKDYAQRYSLELPRRSVKRS
jgi:hypothetical protein